MPFNDLGADFLQKIFRPLCSSFRTSSPRTDPRYDVTSLAKSKLLDPGNPCRRTRLTRSKN
jgi:hypothetical protein